MALVDQNQVVAVPDGVAVVLRDLVHARTGLFYDEVRLSTFIEKLQPLASARGLGMMEYYYRLKDGEESRSEWRRVADALSVQETYFWREVSQIELLVRELVPRWFERNYGPLRIWSAACATGEEPFTIAMALQEAGYGKHPIEIVASDASEAALQKAQRGIYRERSFRALPPHLRTKYFAHVPGGLKISPDLPARVTWRRANLVETPDIRELARAEVVFCRNVFIYFSPEAIRRTVASFAERMPRGSFLFVGISESLLNLTSDFELQAMGDAFVYVRK